VPRAIAAVWRCRYFWLSLVGQDLRNRYCGSMLGLAWSLLQPIASTAILCLVFATILNVDPATYAPYLLIGLTCWQFLAQAALEGCQSFHLAHAYIRQHPLPIAIYPLRTALGLLIHFVPALAVSLATTWWFEGFANVPALGHVALALPVLFLIGYSLAVLAATAHVYFRDTRHLAEVGLSLLYYATPVLYEPQRLEGTPLEWLLRYNPLVPVLALVREPILHGIAPTPAVWAAAIVTALTLFAAAALCLAWLQRRLVYAL
jgi:ABC-type polysaccharide/polyol phosphate export permease